MIPGLSWDMATTQWQCASIKTELIPGDDPWYDVSKKYRKEKR